MVLVCGTPCQITAVRRCFGYRDNLILVDFFCGGIVSQSVLDDYIKYMEKRYNSKIKKINMRSKDKGWSKTHIKLIFENGKKYISHYQFDYYMYYFYSVFLKNDSCVFCKYYQHPGADLTIGDFWGFRKAQIYNDEKGISVVCAHSDIGKNILNDISDKEIRLVKTENEYVEYAFQPKRYSKENLEERKKFMEEVRKTSFVSAAKKNHFKGGKLGVLTKYIIRKALR